METAASVLLQLEPVLRHMTRWHCSNIFAWQFTWWTECEGKMSGGCVNRHCAYFINMICASTRKSCLTAGRSTTELHKISTCNQWQHKVVRASCCSHLQQPCVGKVLKQRFLTWVLSCTISSNGHRIYCKPRWRKCGEELTSPNMNTASLSVNQLHSIGNSLSCCHCSAVFTHVTITLSFHCSLSQLHRCHSVVVHCLEQEWSKKKQKQDVRCSSHASCFRLRCCACWSHEPTSPNTYATEYHCHHTVMPPLWSCIVMHSSCCLRTIIPSLS